MEPEVNIEIPTSINVVVELQLDNYLITTNKGIMQVEVIHKWLSEKAFWAQGITYGEVKSSFDNSFCVGAFYEGVQIGYGRMITDYTSFGYLKDVYIDENHRNIGLGSKMIELFMNLNWVKKLKHIELASRNAKSLYYNFGFQLSECLPDRMVLKQNI